MLNNPLLPERLQLLLVVNPSCVHHLTKGNKLHSRCRHRKGCMFEECSNFSNRYRIERIISVVFIVSHTLMNLLQFFSLSLFFLLLSSLLFSLLSSSSLSLLFHLPLVFFPLSYFYISIICLLSLFCPLLSPLSPLLTPPLFSTFLFYHLPNYSPVLRSPLLCLFFPHFHHFTFSFLLSLSLIPFFCTSPFSFLI